MKRIIYDVPRWHVYMHRQARGLPLCGIDESPEGRLADEIFGRLYTGSDLTSLSDTDVDKKHAPWAAEMHKSAKVTKKTSRKCFRNQKKSAEQTRAIMDHLKKEHGVPAPGPQSAAAAASATQQSRAAAHALEHVAMAGAGAGSEEWQGEEHENARAKALADRLRNDERLKRLSDLAGKFKRIVLAKQKMRVKRGVDEITDIEQGDDISRLLPSELVRFATPRQRLAATRDLFERKCLQYQMTSTELLGRGPIVLCIDKSGSMEGDKDVWASAIGLALLDMAHRQRRAFILLGFNDRVVQTVVCRPGEPLPENALFYPTGGGTNIAAVLKKVLRAVETATASKRSDVILITDGESHAGEAAAIRERAKSLDVTILGVGFGVAKESLEPWCDETHCVTSLDGIDDETATAIWGL